MAKTDRVAWAVHNLPTLGCQKKLRPTDATDATDDPFWPDRCSTVDRMGQLFPSGVG